MDPAGSYPSPDPPPPLVGSGVEPPWPSSPLVASGVSDGSSVSPGCAVDVGFAVGRVVGFVVGFTVGRVVGRLVAEPPDPPESPVSVGSAVSVGSGVADGSGDAGPDGAGEGVAAGVGDTDGSGAMLGGRLGRSSLGRDRSGNSALLTPTVPIAPMEPAIIAAATRSAIAWARTAGDRPRPQRSLQARPIAPKSPATPPVAAARRGAGADAMAAITLSSNPVDGLTCSDRVTSS